MKQVFKSIIPFLAVAVLASCGSSEEKGAAKNDHADHNDQKEATSVAGEQGGAAVDIKDDKLNAVYQHYVHLTGALVKNDAADAKIAANAIETGAKQVDGGEKLAKSAASITAASDIEVQRKEYAQLSNEMIELVKKSGLNSGELYVDYCPMAMDDKGAYWVSAKKEIRNPYFGDKMLTCGEVKETIK